jgi:hypothetical protein
MLLCDMGLVRRASITDSPETNDEFSKRTGYFDDSMSGHTQSVTLVSADMKTLDDDFSFWSYHVTRKFHTRQITQMLNWHRPASSNNPSARALFHQEPSAVVLRELISVITKPVTNKLEIWELV